MKKLLSLMLLYMVCMGAWAQDLIADGNYISLLNQQHNFYLSVYNTTCLTGTTTKTEANVWKLVSATGGYKLYNPETGYYASPISSRNGRIQVTAEAGNAGIYSFEEVDGGYYALNCKNGTDTGHTYFHGVDWTSQVSDNPKLCVVDWDKDANASHWSVAAESYEAPSTSIENGIYEIKNVSNEPAANPVGRGYLIDYTSWANGPTIGDCPWSDYTSKHPTTHNDGSTTSSYWYVYNNPDGTVSIFSLSTLSGNDYPKFLNVPTANAKSTWSDLPVRLNIDNNTSKSGSFSIRNADGSRYLSMGCATNANQGATATDAMSDGGTQLSFVHVEESSLTDDQSYIKSFGIGVIEGTAPAARVSTKKDHYFQINCNGSTANYFNPFTFPTQTENERGVFQLYRVGETAKVYIKEAGSGKYLAYSNTGNGTKKITLTDQAGASQFTVVNNTTYYNIGPSSSTSFNWFGGVGVDPYRIGTDDVMNTIGFYNSTDGNSKWRLNEVTGDAATTAISNSAAFYLATLKNKALAYDERIGMGLGFYNYNGGSITGYTDAVNACEDADALEALTATIAINQPVAGSFIRLKGGVSNEYADANAQADQTNRSERVGMSSDGTGAGSIWYLDSNNKLISFGKGYYIGNTCDHSGTESNALSYIFEASNSTIGRYYIHTSGTVLYDNGAPTDRNCLDRQGLGRIAQTEKWTLEEVTTLPVVLTQVGDLAYASFNAPVAVRVPSNVTAYNATINGDVLELTAFTGTDLAANTPVILTAETAGTYNFNIVATGTTIDDNDLQGTVAKQNVAAGKTTYVLNKKEGKIGFYTSDTFINGFKAYCETPIGGVQKFSFNFNEEMTTAIRAIESENSDAEIFDTAGNRLKKAQKGMNIINGMKVLVK